MLYQPGDVAPESGVNEATHYNHRAAHHVTAASGETFPDCSVCGDAVRFRFPPSRWTKTFVKALLRRLPS